MISYYREYYHPIAVEATMIDVVVTQGERRDGGCI
jgi:hypothetical protein